MPTPIEIFCSYASEDEGWLREIETHLSLLQRQGLLSIWYRRLISPNGNWANSIDIHLETASVILLLVSANFFAHDYCVGLEMKRALERQEAGDAEVIPILVRTVDWTNAPFAHLQTLPTNAKPLTMWKNKDMGLANITAGIRRVITEKFPLINASASSPALPTIWNIPYPRNPFFLGRNIEIEQLHARLQASRTARFTQPYAVSGLGGIGKTQLALEYAYQFSQDYQAVLWAHAEHADALISSYMAIASLLGLPEQKAKEQEMIIQAVKYWLQTHTNWLLILDNADELSLLTTFLPSHPNGHILLTTRAIATGRLAHRMEIETLQSEDGMLFLLRRAGIIAYEAELSRALPQEQQQAKKLTQELGGLPLALDQAGAYLEETGIDLSSYWQLYQQHRADLLSERRGLVADHPQSVATTWSLSFQRVEERQPAAADLLRMCAFLSPTAIPEEIFTQGASFLSEPLSSEATNMFQFNQMMEVLRAYSLLRRDSRGKFLSIHRLVQAVLQDKMTTEERKSWVERAILAINITFPHVEHDTWPQCERLLPQALIATEYIRQENMTTWEASRLLSVTASYLRDRARYEEAEPLYLQALQIREQYQRMDQPLVDDPLVGLANLYRNQGRYTEAELLYQRALQIREQLLGLDHFKIASPLNGLANLYFEQGKHTEAEPLYLRALQIREKQLKSDHPLITYPLNGLANIYCEQGKYTEAESLYQRALQIREHHHELDHPDVGYLFNGLASFYFKQGKYIEAKPLYQQALHILEKALGAGHPQITYLLNNLANLHKEMNKDAEAELLYKQALQLREWHQEIGHPMVAYPLTGLANLYRDQEKYAEAEPLYQKALKIWEQHHGVNHPMRTYPLTGLADLYKNQERYEEAELLYLQALQIREQRHGLDHPLIAYSLNSLANLYRDQKKYAEAERLYLRSLQIRGQHYGAEHSLLAYPLINLANLYRDQKKYAEAEPLYLQALQIREQQLGTQHLDTAEVIYNLAALQEALSNYQEAHCFYQRALVIRKQILGPEHSKTKEAQQRIATLKLEMGK